MVKNSENLGFFHHGIAVDDLQKYLLTLTQLFPNSTFTQRSIDHSYMGELVESQNIKLQVAMLEFFPGNYIELLQWGNLNLKNMARPEITSTGTSHLCIYVENAEDFHKFARKVNGVTLINSKVTEVPVGPNKGAKVFFLMIHELLFIEIFQKPIKIL